jgi:hypothetical protein
MNETSFVSAMKFEERRREILGRISEERQQDSDIGLGVADIYFDGFCNELPCGD